MAFNDLDSHEMISLFSPFITNPKVKAQFLSIKEIAGLYDEVEAAYQGIVAVPAPDPSADAELGGIIIEEKKVDYRHDRLARASVLMLEAHRERALANDPPDEERAAACDAASEAMAPGGTGIINASYRAEAGNTQRANTLLQSEDGATVKAVLKSIPVRKGETLLDTVGLWIEQGSQLDVLETKKAARIAILENAPPTPVRVAQQARSTWIGMATLLVQVLAVSKAPADVKAAIAHPLTDAASKAGRRASRRTGAATPAAPEAPAAPAAPEAPPTP